MVSTGKRRTEWIDVAAKLKSDLREALKSAAGEARLKLETVSDVLAGEDPARVALDAEVPSETVIRWVRVARSGIDTLVNLPRPEMSLEGMHAELPASASLKASPGIERTALRAVAAACRGASVEELASHHGADVAEVREWIVVYLACGAIGMRDRYRHPNWSSEDPEQVFLARSRLPYGMKVSFLRKLHVRSSGEYAKRLLFIALLYEGRSVRQASEAVGVTITAAGTWATAFIRSGLPGLAYKAPVAMVPARKDFSASSVARLDAGISNPEMRRRLSAVELAYRSVPPVEIADITGLSTASVRSVIHAFEADGLEGLSTGEAALTPPLRDDYSSQRLMAIADGMDDDEPGRKHMTALARLYDGVSMMEAGREIRGLPAIRLLVDRFNRFGHGAAMSFKSWMRPVAPPQRKPAASPPPPPPAKPVPPKMRKDLDETRLRRIRDMYKQSGRERIDVILDAYAGMTVEEIVMRRHRSEPTIRSYIEEFNSGGLKWLEQYRKTHDWSERSARIRDIVARKSHGRNEAWAEKKLRPRNAVASPKRIALRSSMSVEKT